MKIVNVLSAVTNLVARISYIYPLSLMTGRTFSIKSLLLMLLIFLEGILIFTGPLPAAQGARIDVFSDQSLSGDHRQDSILMSKGTLHIRPDTILGSPHSYSVFEGGHLIVSGAVAMEGENLFHGDVRADIGTDASARSLMGFVALHQQAITHFDHVLLTGFNDGDPYGATEALQLNDHALATLTARTQVMSLSPGSDAIDMYDHSMLSAQGSPISGQRNGIRMSGETLLSLHQTMVSGQSNGIVASDNARVAIVGGGVISHGKPDGSDLPVAGLLAGGKTFMASPSGVRVHIARAYIHGDGDGAAGIASASGDATTTRVAVSRSVVSGQEQGLRFFHRGHVTSDSRSEFSASQTLISSSGDAVIKVDKDARANITLTDGTQVLGGHGNALTAGQHSEVRLRIENTAIQGNIINHGGTVDITLNDRAQWQGGVRDGTAVSLGTGTDWTLSASSSVKTLTNQGRLWLSSRGGARHTLTVNHYVGEDGELHFNGVLAGDASPTDKVTILEGSTGHSDVSVTNLGGIGDQTLNGIELIQVKGNAQGRFTQKGRITAGLYEYSLHHNADWSSWFLTSRNSHTTAVGEAVYRPETGSYLANIETARSLFVLSRHERGEKRWVINPQTGQPEETSLWLVQSVKHQRFNDGSGQISTKENRYVVQGGGNVAQFQTDARHDVQIGLMAGHGNSRHHSHSRISGYTSRGGVDGYSLGLYATWDAREARDAGAYVDTWAHYSWLHQQVNGHGLAAEAGSLSGVTGSVESGYTFHLGNPEQPGLLSGYSVTPSAQLIWMGIHGAGATEQNGTRVEQDRQDNYQTRVGVRMLAQEHPRPEAWTGTEIAPYIEANWIHNTTAVAVAMDGERDQMAGARDIGEAKVGIDAQLNPAIRLWASVAHQRGQQGYQNSSAFTGMKYTF